MRKQFLKLLLCSHMCMSDMAQRLVWTVMLMMIFWLCIKVAPSTANFTGSPLSSVTFEEGRAATLQCPGFTPTPGGDQSALFNWYKARVGDIHNDNRVAFLAKRDGVVISKRDLYGRATIDSTTVALQITQTIVSDDHVYTCLFSFTSMGWIENEIHLTITVTPSKQDLQVTANPSGPVPVGESVTFNCSAPRVRPPPQEMYWQFTDETQNFGNHRSVTNSDGLTSSVSAQYSLTVSRSHHGRKLVCHYVSSTRHVSSEEMTIMIQVLFKPIGKPSLKSNKTVVKVNSKVDLKCDSSQLSGSATWFAWQFMNGTVLWNTTQPTWTYDVKEKEETLHFVCIAGNWLGQSDTSEPLSINVQSPDPRYIGCFEDDSSFRASRWQQYTSNVSVLMTVDACAATCAKYQQALSGLTNGNECWCTNTTVFNRTKCDGCCEVPCQGNTFLKCGGRNAFDVYEAVVGSRYLGCYDRWYGIRLLSRSQLSVDHCIQECGQQNYSLAGIEGQECWCSHLILLIPHWRCITVEDCICNWRCPGNQTEICGGHYALSFYRAECREQRKWGSNCTETCHCNNGAPCNISTGQCPNDECAPGWTGPTCNQDCKNQKSCDLLAKSAYTNRLQNILLSNESNDKALQEVHELIQDSPSSLEAQDVRYLSDILDKAPEKDSEYILKLVDITLETNKSVLQNAQQEWNASSRILKKLANYAENIKLDATGKSISVESNIALAVWDATANATLPFAFGVEQDSDVGLSKNNVKSHFQPDSYTTYSNNSAAIVLNSQLIQRTRHAKINDSKAVRLSFTIFRKGELFLSPPPGSGSAGKPVSISNSIIVAGTIHNVNTSDLSDPIVLIFKPIKNISEHTPTCAFWDFSLNGGNGKWSSEGCSFNGTLEDKVICQCWHLTHFAILGSIDQSENEGSHAIALDIITITGTTLSITGLAFTIITFLAFRQFRKARSQKVLFNLALSLLAVNVIFLGGINATPKHGHNAIVCKFVAALLQYFLLVSFAWMLVEAIMQYLQLVKVFDSYVPRFMLKTCVPAWVLPSVPVIVVASLDHELLNDHPVKHCWLGQIAFYYAFLLPVGTVIIINTVLFIIVIKSITCDRPKLQCSMPDIELKKLQVNSGITCFILMGLAWIFGFMAISHARLAFQYLFCIFNAFQGFFIFVFCIMQSPAIRNAWRQLFVSKAAQVGLITASSSHKVTESTRL